MQRSVLVLVEFNSLLNSEQYDMKFKINVYLLFFHFWVIGCQTSKQAYVYYIIAPKLMVVLKYSFTLQ